MLLRLNKAVEKSVSYTHVIPFCLPPSPAYPPTLLCLLAFYAPVIKAIKNSAPALTWPVKYLQFSLTFLITLISRLITLTKKLHMMNRV